MMKTKYYGDSTMNNTNNVFNFYNCNNGTFAVGSSHSAFNMENNINPLEAVIKLYEEHRSDLKEENAILKKEIERLKAELALCKPRSNVFN